MKRANGDLKFSFSEEDTICRHPLVKQVNFEYFEIKGLPKWLLEELRKEFEEEEKREGIE